MNGFGLPICDPAPNSPVKLAVPFTLTPCTVNLRSTPANGAREEGTSKLEPTQHPGARIGDGESLLLQKLGQPELSRGPQRQLQVLQISETPNTKALVDVGGVFWIINTSFGFFSVFAVVSRGDHIASRAS